MSNQYDDFTNYIYIPGILEICIHSEKKCWVGSITNFCFLWFYINCYLYVLHTIDLFILKNMGEAIIDFRVCPPLVKCKNLMFSGFIDMLMYGFSSTGVAIYCYFGLKFSENTCCEVICKRRYNDNDIMTTNKLLGMYFLFNYRYFPHTKSV